MNNCPCILCHIGRNASFEGDFAPLDKLIEAISAYDTSLSPYPFSDTDKADMTDYISKGREPSGNVHFDVLEYFFWERHEALEKEANNHE